jgi:hypothetical protein
VGYILTKYSGLGKEIPPKGASVVLPKADWRHFAVRAGLLAAALAGTAGLMAAYQQQAPATPEGITVEGVIKLVQIGASDDVIIARLRQANKPMPLSNDDVINLTKNRVAGNIQRVMMDPSANVVPPSEPRLSVTLVTSICALLISCFSAFAAIGSWRAIHKQIEVQNLLGLSNYLHQTEYREARHTIRTGTPGDLDAEALRKLCSSFDFAALFVHKKLVRESMFLDYWGSLLVFLRGHLSGDLDKLWFGELTGRQYYRHFDWLLERAAKDQARFCGPVR